MDKKDGLGKGKFRNNAWLLAVLIGFCILAIIEIVYGQAQLRMERERLALAEENNQAVQELKDEWNNLKGEPSVGSGSVEAVGEEQSVSEQPEKTLINTDEPAVESSESSPTEEDDRHYDMQIVFMGDSILDSDRDNAGVPALIGEGCNAKIYNMAIGGTTAAVMYDETREFDRWESTSLVGIVNAIVGNISPEIFDKYEAGKVLKECDFSQTDYFVIEYGLNDFLCGKVPQSKYWPEGEELDISAICTYVGAVEYAVNTLRTHFPNAKIFVFLPHYCQFFDGEKYLGDSYTVNKGYGTLLDFSRCLQSVLTANYREYVMCYDTIEYSGIDAYTADEYLEDGIHLSEAGRRSYAEHAVYRILADFYPEE
ncbi:MAG: SGNH/GDSL hydrolase family protein [Lachnospiraceae bacterium]|nr:SGNH/GDSL hydrolase family protein [Lachnospiraceae bacterium]